MALISSARMAVALHAWRTIGLALYGDKELDCKDKPMLFQQCWVESKPLNRMLTSL